MTLTQLRQRYSDYEIESTKDIVSGKKLYRVYCPDMSTFTANSIKELESGLIDSAKPHKDPETYYSHSLTNVDPEVGQYKVTIKQGDDHYEEETFNSKSEVIAYADHMWETMADVSIVDIEYIPETESEETENQIEILRANDNDPWVYVVFQNNLQTQFTIQVKNETRSLWGVYEGDRLCYDIYGLDNAVSYVKGRLG
jgi:viroplasmin and RNaseH domain-containing protein